MASSLPRRDLWLIPLICLLALAALLITAECGARIFYPEQPEDSCKIADSRIGARFLPNCTSTQKAAEGPWVTMHYNAYGLRSDPSWTPFPPGTRRIALVGTSFAQGYLLPYDQTAGATLASSLTAACRAPVEVANVGTNGFSAQLLERRVQDALALKPKSVLIMFVSHGLLSINSDLSSIQAGEPHAGGLIRRLREFAKSLRAVTVFQHFLVRNAALYIPLYLRNADVADFLRVPFTPAWQQRLSAFDAVLGRLAASSRAAGATLALVYVPQEVQAVLVNRHSRLPGIDPLAFGAAIDAMAAKHGIVFHDSTTDFQVLADPQEAYYPADGHASGKGQTIIGVDLARQFLTDVPAFSDCRSTHLATTANRP